MVVVQFRGEAIQSKEIRRVLWLVIKPQVYI
jgi:hypothetical protein